MCEEYKERTAKCKSRAGRCTGHTPAASVAGVASQMGHPARGNRSLARPGTLLRLLPLTKVLLSKVKWLACTWVGAVGETTRRQQQSLDKF